MRLCSFKIDNQVRLGVLVQDSPEKLFDVTDAVGGVCDVLPVAADADVFSVIAQLADKESRGNVDTEGITFLPPIGRPGKIVCLAGNYRAHIVESGYVEPQPRANFSQQLFLKPSSSLLGHGGTIDLGPSNHRVGWEAELAVVIGKGGRYIKAEDAFDHVFGYTILNDVSERGLNSRVHDRHHREMDAFCDWLAGKWFDGFAPCGPYVVTKDDVPRPHELEIKFFLNGELRQHGRTEEMMFSIPEQIEYISSIMTLEPGDIISTGTPSGAGLGDNRTSLADGDEMTCEIEDIGVLGTTVRCRK